ncbi:MAG: hypothetical protein HRT57_14695 [Crocinitomicaceae bacterium]|nr:hypothetical protein [Crocinitomicaceae bacterium]
MRQQEKYNIGIEQITGMWHIDSTAESGRFGQTNMRDATNDEYFVFLIDKTFKMEKVENGDTISFTYGTFEIISDTIKIKTLKGAPGMDCIMTPNGNNLRLDGTFTISGPGSNKPIFFLSNNESKRELLSNSVFASDRQVIYRGIENTITINIDPSADEYQVEYSNCKSFERGETPYTYVLTPGRGRSIGITVKCKNSSTEVISKYSFNVKNIPFPVLFFGDTRNGRKCNLDATNISAKYPPEMHLDLESKIIRWELYSQNYIFEGTGSELSEEAKTHLKTLKGEGAISIITVVRGPDGIARRVGGVYSY